MAPKQQVSSSHHSDHITPRHRDNISHPQPPKQQNITINYTNLNGSVSWISEPSTEKIFLQVTAIQQHIFRIFPWPTSIQVPEMIMKSARGTWGKRHKGLIGGYIHHLENTSWDDLQTLHNLVVHSVVSPYQWLDEFHPLRLGNVNFFRNFGSLKKLRKFELHPENQPIFWPLFSTFLTIILHSEPPKNLFPMPWDWLVHMGFAHWAISWSLQFPRSRTSNQPAGGSFCRSGNPHCIVRFGVQALWSTDRVGPETMPGLWAEAGFNGKIVHRKSQVSKWHPKLSNNHVFAPICME